MVKKTSGHQVVENEMVIILQGGNGVTVCLCVTRACTALSFSLWIIVVNCGTSLHCMSVTTLSPPPPPPLLTASLQELDSCCCLFAHEVARVSAPGAWFVVETNHHVT